MEAAMEKKKITLFPPRHGSTMPDDVTTIAHRALRPGPFLIFFYPFLIFVFFSWNEAFLLPYSHTRANIRRQSFLEVLSFPRSLFLSLPHLLSDSMFPFLR